MDFKTSHACDVQELADLLKSPTPPVLLDVREQWEVDLCKLHNALHIPLAALRQRATELPKNKDIVVYCHHGVRSMQAAAMLRLNGYPSAVSLQGGINAWAQQVDTTMKKY
jgi:rhodanese-related sulfurtransferase